jgi:hypothetical protein
MARLPSDADLSGNFNALRSNCSRRLASYARGPVKRSAEVVSPCGPSVSTVGVGGPGMSPKGGALDQGRLSENFNIVEQQG